MTLDHKLTTYRSTGSDGYSPGTWGYILTIGDDEWTNAGHASEKNAKEHALRRLRLLSLDAQWHCYDRCSGERFEVHGGDEDAIRRGVEAYIREGIDADTGGVDYDVVATAVDGSEYTFSGTAQPVNE